MEKVKDILEEAANIAGTEKANAWQRASACEKELRRVRHQSEDVVDNHE